MGIEEVADPEGYDLQTTVGLPVLIKVRSVVKRSSGVARLDTTPFPFFLLDFAADVPLMKEAGAA